MSYLGIDVGGTNIKTVIMQDFSGVPLLTQVFPTLRSKEAFLVQLEQISEVLIRDNEVKGIGVGVPGMVSMADNKLLKAPQLPFLDGASVLEWFSFTKLPVKVDNDSRSFLRAEARWGAAKDYKQAIGIAIGTGIGGGILIDGKIYYGAHGSDGEFGHMMFGITNNNSSQIQEWERLGSLTSNESIPYKSEIVGIGIANLINSLDPEIVVLGGGAIVSKVLDVATIEKVARQYIISPVCKDTPIVEGKLGYYAQAMGTTLLFEEK